MRPWSEKQSNSHFEGAETKAELLTRMAQLAQGTHDGTEYAGWHRVRRVARGTQGGTGYAGWRSQRMEMVRIPRIPSWIAPPAVVSVQSSSILWTYICCFSKLKVEDLGL